MSPKSALEGYKLTPGLTIGSWRLQEPLGKGGQGEVWRVRHATTKHSPSRALKACLATDAKSRERFKREVEFLKAYAHRYIMPVIDSDLSWGSKPPADSEVSYLVMELGNGTIDSYPGADILRTLELFKQACEAVTFLHNRESPVLHRDIKPSNLLVGSERFRVLVSDFGIATDEGRQGELTETHEVVGSQIYRAPEVAMGGPATVRSDVYSLGKVLERVLTNQVPNQEKPRPVPPGGLLSDRLCAKLDEIITKATAWDPSGRYQTVGDFLEAIPPLQLDSVEVSPVQVTEGASPAETFDPVEATKEYVLDEKAHIKLIELVNSGTEEVRAALTSGFPATGIVPTGEGILKRLHDYDEITATLRDILIVGAAFGQPSQTPLWTGSMQRLLEDDEAGGYTIWIHLRLYPALILQYAAGVGALYGKRYGVLDAVITQPEIRRLGERELASLWLYPYAVLNDPRRLGIPGWEGRSAPFHNHIQSVLFGSALRTYIPSDSDFYDLFDRFEYYRAMIYADVKAQLGVTKDLVPGWVPVGIFGWGRRGRGYLPEIIESELESKKDHWEPVTGGLFGGNYARARQAQTVVKEFANRLRRS